MENSPSAVITDSGITRISPLCQRILEIFRDLHAFAFLRRWGRHFFVAVLLKKLLFVMDDTLIFE